jgi:hypothetical protein
VEEEVLEEQVLEIPHRHLLAKEITAEQDLAQVTRAEVEVEQEVLEQLQTPHRVAMLVMAVTALLRQLQVRQ